ncbi:chromate reductase [Paracoccus isoporae]|uniref:Chromate reductase n=1 Tax=Paracoccus isoporae TaxID=591205 RepID=A0A1G6ZKP6_9RHOB|nr:NAD(P)H-dependent oxidoreductase [Paracoccus isoporae]SDE03100.1 chromate reductase [Paracoccus isoporae]
MRLYGFAASTRPDSVNRALFAHLEGVLADRGHSLSELDYAVVEDLPLYTDLRERVDGVPAEIRQIAQDILAADGLLIVSPEYNFSTPGPLKNAIDWLSRIRPYATRGKPVLLAAASGSPLGGWRGLAALRVPLACLGAHVLPWDITLGGVRSADEVNHSVATPALRERISLAVDQLGR